MYARIGGSRCGKKEFVAAQAETDAVKTAIAAKRAVPDKAATAASRSEKRSGEEVK